MKKVLLVSFLAAILSFAAFGQFEESQIKGEDFEKLKVRLGADFAMQYQVLDHFADSALIPLGTGFNLPTANMVIESLLAPGIKVNLTTYLSSRHHNETWVKGGYLIIDELPFFKSEKIDRLMDYLTLRVGDMDINFGDAHFRRSDNGHVVSNPFVGNYIVDAFSTQIAAELMFRSNGWLLMGAVSTGSLKPALAGYSASSGYTAYDTHRELAFYWKGGYDRQLSDDFRIRLTLSGYHSPNHHFGSLYYGDRAGSRYYLVMNRVTNSPNDVDITKNHLSGSWSPGFTDKNNAFMFNLFSRYKGLEFFGTFENMNATSLAGAEIDLSQYAVEGIYRFGNEEQFYGGLRYNRAWNKSDQYITRFQAGAGWNIIESILLKLEYVNQNYSGFTSQYGADAGFKGVMVEAAISF
ncbi:MAG: hypothetical protein EP313_00360 [Bacteroidetes bacterium]|nr:MAG: hypothetical protein EP313_00360 [Bacteroidota bacterium]